MSDAELVRQALAGHSEAYEELVRRWAGRITALCHAKVGRSHLAEELAQETLLRGYRGLRSLAAPDRFGAWLTGIALRTCLDWLKARERSQINFSALRPEQNPEDLLHCRSDDRTLERDVEHAHLLREVEALPEQYRKVILLYYYEDITYRELAQLLGVSAATVNARLTKARALLRSRLSPAGR